MKKFLVVGGGAFGTAIANAFSSCEFEVTLLCRRSDVVDEINSRNSNSLYLPGVPLLQSLRAVNVLPETEYFCAVFLSVPVASLLNVAAQLNESISSKVVFVNLAKGFSREYLTLDHELRRVCKSRPIASLKGPSFARPLSHLSKTGFTLASEDEGLFEILTKGSSGRSLRFESWKTISEVEFVSALKNVYAIILGLCDGIDDNPNTKFFIMKLVIDEIRELIKLFEFDPDVIFTWAGLADMLMTGLNDSSRNRTLGLLMGRGFRFDGIGAGPLFEGRKAIDLLSERTIKMKKRPFLLVSLGRVFSNELNPITFYKEILSLCS